MRRVIMFTAKRLPFVLPQLLGVSFVTFLLVRLLPGDPVRAILGAFATEEGIRALTERLGLDKPILVQYVLYIRNLSQGDMGISIRTGQPVLTDILQRLPATLELITISLVLSLLIMIPLGAYTARRGKGLASRSTFAYGMLAGAIPDFWLALIMVFVFFFTLRIAPAPLGRMGITAIPPTRITGMHTVDSLLTLNGAAFGEAASHLALPVITLVFVYGGPILKMTHTTMNEIMNSEFVLQAKAAGLSERVVTSYALRNALPPVITIIGVIYGYLLGGAVLVEQVFSWGGLGQYAVQAISNSDFPAIQGFVLIAAMFSLFVYLLVDICYFILDPRVTI